MNLVAPHPPARPAAVVFDCGGTLLHADTSAVRGRLVEAGVALHPDGNLTESLTRAADMDKWALPDLRTPSPFFDIWALLSGIDDPRGPGALQEASVGHVLFTELDPDAVSTLAGLRERGLKVGVLANDDGELPDELEQHGLSDLVDAAASSQRVGLAKPDPRAFHHVTGLLDEDPSRCWYVGDSVMNDYLGSLFAGFGAAYMYDRYDALSSIAVRRVRRLGELLTEVDRVTRRT